MKNVTVNVSVETAKKLLLMINTELAELHRQTAAKEQDAKELKRVVASGDGDMTQSLPLSVDKSAASGRARKGQSEKAIRAFIESNRGSYSSAFDVAEKTGTTLSTTIRILKKLQDEGLVRRNASEKTWGHAA